MPPRNLSRHTFTTQVTRADGYVYLTDREKFTYAPYRDNVSHTVTEGETLWTLAATYYAELSDPPAFSAASLWWVIADFQPQPIHDPTVQFLVGETLIIPSLATVRNRVFNPNERAERGGLRG